MSRTVFPFVADDMSVLARALGRQLAGEPNPGHVQILNMLARAIGYRNFQHFRAQSAAAERLAAAPPHEAVDHITVERAARHFDADGRLVRWPARASQQQLCLWVLWSRIAADAIHSEATIGELLRASHLFGDHALLRRSLVDAGMVRRTADGREYRRIERRPPADALALIRRLGRSPADGKET